MVLFVPVCNSLLHPFSAPRREEAGASHQEKGIGRSEEAKKDGGRKGDVPYKERSAARMEKELEGRAKKED